MNRRNWGLCLLIGVVGANSFCWRPAYCDVDLAFVSGLCNNIIYTSAKLSYYCGKRQANTLLKRIKGTP